MQVKTKELKPPAEIIDAIQNSEDGSTAPSEAETLGGVGATREIGNKLLHEEQQKPSDLPDEMRMGNDHGAGTAGGVPMDSEEKKLKFMEMQEQQQQAMKYDRQHPGAGKAGKGDQAIDSMQGVSRFAKGQTGAHDHRGVQVHRG